LTDVILAQLQAMAQGKGTRPCETLHLLIMLAGQHTSSRWLVIIFCCVQILCVKAKDQRSNHRRRSKRKAGQNIVGTKVGESKTLLIWLQDIKHGVSQCYITKLDAALWHYELVHFASIIASTNLNF